MSNFADKNDNSSRNEPESMDKYIKFLQTIKPLSDKIEKIRKDYNFTKPEQFNIFTAISDKYHKENLHSDILKGLLENNYMDDCYDLLKEIKYKNGRNIPDIEFDNSFSFVREEGRRDISIYSESQSHGIFIESKINGADDREDQLVKYYKSLKEKIGQVDVVVYIPSIGSEDGPPLKDYADQDTAEEINNILVILPVITKSRKKDIVHGFLDRIADNEHDDETMRVFIKQYSKFLKDWGEKIMEKKEKKELLKKLLKNKTNVKMTYNIYDVCNDVNIIGEIIGENIVKKIEGFKKKNDYEYIKIIKLNSGDICIDFVIKDKECRLELWSDYKSKWKRTFEKILNDDAFSKCFSSPAKKSAKWDGAWKTITYLGEWLPLQEKIDFVIEKIKILEKKCRQIIV